MTSALHQVRPKRRENRRMSSLQELGIFLSSPTKVEYNRRKQYKVTKMHKRKISKNGQINLPAQIRKQLDLQKGDTVSLQIEGNTILIRRVAVDHSLELKRIIQKNTRIKEMTKVEIQQSFDYGNWDHLPNHIAGEEEI